MPIRESTPPDNAELGDFVESFSARMASILFLLAFSAALAAGCVATIWFALRGASQAQWRMAFYEESGWCWSGFIAACLCGLVLIGLGISLAIYANRLRLRSVKFYVNGFQYHDHHGVEQILWSSIVRVRETISSERRPGLKFPAVLLASRGASSNYTLITSEGKEFNFDPEWIGDITRFGKFLWAEARRDSLPWEYANENKC